MKLGLTDVSILLSSNVASNLIRKLLNGLPINKRIFTENPLDQAALQTNPRQGFEQAPCAIACGAFLLPLLQQLNCQFNRNVISLDIVGDADALESFAEVSTRLTLVHVDEFFGFGVEAEFFA